MIIRSILYAFCVTILSFSANAQNKSYPSPPGTVQLSDHLYIDAVPINNLMFREYLRYQEKLSEKKLDSILENSNSFGLNAESIIGKREIDTTNQLVWIESTIKKDYYLERPKFQYFPVISVSKSEAISYCRWRSKAVMLNYAVKSKTEEERQSLPKLVTYRLPTSQELEMAVDNFGYSKGIKSNIEGIPFLAFRNGNKKKNKKVILIKDNLSEFISNGLVYWANWGNHEPIEDANDFTTFRCICEVTE